MQPEVRDQLVTTWIARAVSEHEQVSRFEAYARRMELFGVAPELIERTREAAADEQRHKALCLAVVRRFGGAEPAFEPFEFWRKPDGREVLLANVVATCCLMETLNAPFLALCLETAQDPEMRDVLRELLKDEINHGRLGWAYLAWARQQGEGQRLAEELPAMIVDQASPKFFTGAPHPPEPHEAELARFGQLTVPQRQKIFFNTFNEVIFPGLEGNGVSTQLGRQWMAKPVWRSH